MPRSMGSATLTFGMVSIPVKIAKASSQSTPSLTSICECGGKLGYCDDPVQCKDCGERYSWWNQVPGKAFELGDDLIPLTTEEVEQAKNAEIIDTGKIEKVVPVKRVFLEYNIEGNYYLMPDEDFGDQYGALVAALNERDLSMLTYLRLRTKTQRYAIASVGGVLLALQLADKKPLPDLEYGHDAALEAQAGQLLDSMTTDDAALADVEGDPLKAVIRERMDETTEEEPEADAPEAFDV